MLNDAIIFDFFGVICSEIAPFWLAKYLLKEEAKKIKATIIHAADTGKLSQQEMFDKLGEIVRLPAEQVEKEWWSYVIINTEVVEIVRRLRVNHTVALLTNSPAQFVRGILSKHDLFSLFDSIIVSSEERCAKPNLTIYERTLERLSAHAENTLMIDDNPINIEGAIDVGMKGLVFESPAQLRKALTDLNYLLTN